ncbi:MAG: hypothetical protein FD143_930 [Ignavibacteria bacterium]|nr:MAG: hypothetical protein FD143_930 [Ignavibacteria bacterium]KAF0161173.1 MAG: hypothetical protein FD188_1084 [Ignavibacteria bacterium]
MNSFDGIISLLIACLELGYIVNILIFAEKNFVNKLILGTIILLFGYQFFEFLICFAGLKSQYVVYIAFLDITLLPPLGLYSVLAFSGKLGRHHKLIFIPALFFIVYYFFTIDQIAVTKCSVLYVVYSYPLGHLYATFYYLPIIGSILILNKKWGAELDVKKKAQTRLLFFGYLFTLLPSMVIALFVPLFVTAVESLLCKMGFILATFSFIFVMKNKNIKAKDKHE